MASRDFQSFYLKNVPKIAKKGKKNLGKLIKYSLELNRVMKGKVSWGAFNCQAFVQISNPKSSIQRFGQKADIIIPDHQPHHVNVGIMRAPFYSQFV